MNAIFYADDLGTKMEVKEIPADMLEQAQQLRAELIEKAADYDDELMMKVLEGEEPTIPEIKAAIRKGVCSSEFFPVLCGSAYKNKGVQLMLDAVIDYLPSPLDIPAIQGHLEDGTQEARHADDKEPFSALAFKVATDPFVGRLTYFRVYSGMATAGSLCPQRDEGYP